MPWSKELRVDLPDVFPSYQEWLDTVAHPDDSICRTEEIYRYARGKHVIARRLLPKVIVEIGVRLGHSAHAFLRACPAATYIGMDLPGAGHGGTKVAGLDYVKKMLARHFPTAVVELHAVNTQMLTKYEGPKPDLFHVDGDHTFIGAMHDLHLAWNSGATYILIDDYTFLPDVKRAVDIFIRDIRPKTEFMLDTVRGDVLLTR